MSRRAWIATILAVVTAACLVRFGMVFPWARTLEALADADWLLLAAAAAVNVLSLVAKAAAWSLLVRRAAPLRPWTAQVATFAGAAVSSVSVSVSGEMVRAQVAGGKDGIPFGMTISSLILSRIVEAVGLLVFLSLTFIALPPWPWARFAGFGFAIILAGAALAYRRAPWHRLRTGTLGQWRDTFTRLLASTNGRDLAGALALATASWLAQWATYHWSIAATHTPVTAAVSLSALVVANLAGILRLTPSNIGITQGSLILGMHLFGIAAATALAAGLALQAVQVLPILAIGLAIVGRRGFRQLAATASEPSA